MVRSSEECWGGGEGDGCSGIWGVVEVGVDEGGFGRMDGIRVIPMLRDERLTNRMARRE